MQEPDILQRFLFEDWHIRGEIIRLQHTYQAVSERHTYPVVVRQQLGQALAATALMSATIKFAGKLTLQIQSEGPIHLLIVQSDQTYQLRGLAKWEGEVTEDNFLKTFNNGQMALTIAPEKGERYQGVVELMGAGLARSLENYFHQSEQLPTCIHLFADENFVGGILLQAMPGNFPDVRFDFWQQVTAIAKSLTLEDLMLSGNKALLQQLYPADAIRLFDAAPVCFHCDCTVERMERALRVLGEKEINKILQEHKEVVVTCEFCNYKYGFSAGNIQHIFADKNGDERAS